MLVPTGIVPKLMLPGETISCPGLAPVPDSATLIVGSEAFDVNVRLPLDVPLEVGAKATLRVKLCPGVRLSGAVKPLRLNPAPVTVG